MLRKCLFNFFEIFLFDFFSLNIHFIQNRFLVTYREALVFRCSHYFISFMSAAALSASGIEGKSSSDIFGYQVTRPLDIEVPRSLVSVVISWNLPIHYWVKNCKFFYIIFQLLLCCYYAGMDANCQCLSTTFLSFIIFNNLQFFFLLFFNQCRYFWEREAIRKIQCDLTYILDNIISSWFESSISSRVDFNWNFFICRVSIAQYAG
jgi:hypothetical protein